MFSILASTLATAMCRRWKCRFEISPTTTKATGAQPVANSTRRIQYISPEFIYLSLLGDNCIIFNRINFFADDLHHLTGRFATRHWNTDLRVSEFWQG